ncbi:MAG: hypothetical protein ACHQFW_05970 [Chitinophagales bacterium]
MRNVRIIIAVLFVFSALAVSAQPKKYKVDGKKCVRVEITDPGEFYSTYNIEEAEIEMLKAQKVKPILLDHIINNHTEDKWPAQLGNLDSRVANPEKIKSYAVYKVAKMDDKFVLVVPASHNSDKGEGWAPTRDIFFVVGSTGVKE